jgi:hypothetical protein
MNTLLTTSLALSLDLRGAEPVRGAWAFSRARDLQRLSRRRAASAYSAWRASPETIAVRIATDRPFGVSAIPFGTDPALPDGEFHACQRANVTADAPSG